MNQGISLFNQTMADYLIKNKRYLLKRPAYIGAFSKIAANIKQQAKTREELASSDNLVVPPVLILSVTSDCNLSCAGCYANAQQRDKGAEMNICEIGRVVDEADELGVAIVLLAGGEPLMKEGILDIPKKHNDTLFVMFTNGLLLDETMNAKMKKIKNLIPIVSIEGSETTTDLRRGAGVYDRVIGAMDRLNKQKRLFGVSITITSHNYDEVLGSDYLIELETKGCRAVFLIEYVPEGDSDAALCLTDAQKQDLMDRESAFAHDFDMLIVALPGNEEKYGGCLASGRGFLHISATGSLEACPFAPYSDTNVKDTPLKQALKSKLLGEIRDNHHLLKESRGGCALNENKEWIAELTARTQ